MAPSVTTDDCKVCRRGLVTWRTFAWGFAIVLSIASSAAYMARAAGENTHAVKSELRSATAVAEERNRHTAEALRRIEAQVNEIARTLREK